MRRPARRHWGPAGATLMAGLACYGTTLALAALSSIGVVVTLHEGLWAATISLFAILALAALLLNCRDNGATGPAMLAAAGAACLLWAMFGSYHWATELAGLATLTVAAAWDWRLRPVSRTEEFADDERNA